MKIDTEYLRRHYADLSDEALLEIDRSELVEGAQRCYDEEVARRRSMAGQDAGTAPLDDADAADEEEDGPGPEWLESAACVCTFVQMRGIDAQVDAADARDVLKAAGIPCRIALQKTQEEGDAAERQPEWRVLVPGARTLEAVSVLDRDLFNARLEAEWQAHLEVLSDEDLRALNPEKICAGFLDRAERLRRVYRDEMARRR